MTTSMILKLIGSLLFVSIIFFGSFLAYIVFNPDQAGFFISVFRIDPNDVANLLKSLINVSFGILIGALAIAWIIILFRAIWTPKEQKRKRILGWFLAVLTGIVLFGLLAFWAYLFETINATDYTNPGGRVLVYDNELYIHETRRPISRIMDFTNIIGPISLRFDISQNAKQVSEKNGITISQFDIDFDGALCEGERSQVRGSNPLTASAIVCTFDQIRSYDIQGTYTYTTRLGEQTRVEIPINPVEIRGLVNITSQRNREGKNTITIDASRVRNLGIPRWIYDTKPQKTVTENSISETPGAIPLLVCLQILRDNDCDRYFVIHDKNNIDTAGTIDMIEDPSRKNEYIFSLSGLNIQEDDILDIEWMLNNTSRICENSTK